MVINELLKKGMTLIEDVEYANPLLESILILSHILKKDKIYIYLNGDKEVDKWVEEEFFRMIEKRVQSYPIAYLLREKEFMGLDFYIEEGVLIPRPETEIMIEYIIDYVENNYRDKEIKILDIGTGSGVIAISLADFLPNAKVYGIDIESKAIKISNRNKSKLGVENVFFFQGDLFEALKNQDEKFEIIVSNPPYIGRDKIDKLQLDVQKFEPLKALDGGIDGLDFYRQISKGAKKYLKPNGMLIYEIGHNQGKQVEEILSSYGFSDINIIKDFQGKERIIWGFLNRGEDCP